MSDSIPQFKAGDRCQVMQTTDNVSYGIASICGVVVERNNLDAYKIFLEDGRFIQIHGASLNHVSEETYHRWENNGVKTWEAWKPK